MAAMENVRLEQAGSLTGLYAAKGQPELSKAASNGQAGRGAEFDSYLQGAGSQKNEVQANTAAASSAQKDPVQAAKDAVAGQQDGDKAVQDTYSQPKEVSAEQSSELTSDSGVQDSSPDDGANQVLDTIREDIKGIVKENLSLDDEQIMEALGVLGMDLMDLLNPNMLKQFVLEVNGSSDTMDFLLDGDMMADFTLVLDSLTDFVSDNMETLAVLFEELGTPVALEEFLHSEDVSFADLLPQADVAGAGSLQQVMQEQVEVTENDLAAGEPKTASAMEHTALNGNGENLEQVEKLTIHTEQAVETEGEDTVIVKASPEQETADSSGEGQDSSMAGQKQADSSLLYAESSVTEAREDVVQPLFAGQLNSVQGNVADIVPQQGMYSQNMQQMIDIVHQVTEQIRSQIDANTTTMELQLHPESLGRVHLSVVAKEGIMAATFRVESEEAKYALESQMVQLKESFEEKQLKVESVEVEVSDFSFGQSAEAERQKQEAMEQGKKRFRFDDMGENGAKDEGNDEVSAEAVRRQVMRDTGSSIDFTA